MVGNVIGTKGWLSKPLALRMRIKRSESDGVRINQRKPPPNIGDGHICAVEVEAPKQADGSVLAVKPAGA